jgi:hypothetical protein
MGSGLPRDPSLVRAGSTGSYGLIEETMANARSFRTAALSFMMSFLFVTLLGFFTVVKHGAASSSLLESSYVLNGLEMEPGLDQLQAVSLAETTSAAASAPKGSISSNGETYPYYLDFPLKPASDLEDWRLDTPTTTGKTNRNT